MTRLNFLITSILSALASLIPWRRKPTVEAWMENHGITMEFSQDKWSDGSPVVRAQMAMAGRAGPFMLVGGQLDDKMKRDILSMTRGLAHKFTKPWLILDSNSGPEDWAAVEMTPLKFDTIEVYFPVDLLA